MRFVKRALTATTVAVTIGMLGAIPASASTTWSTLCAGYAGTSWYSAGPGMGYASTTASDNDEVGAAIRYSGGSINYQRDLGYSLVARAAVLYGGYHQSYCFPGTQTRSSSI